MDELNRENSLGSKQRTYSCVYKDDSDTAYCDESEYIELIASNLNVDNYQITSKVTEIPYEHFLMIESFESSPENTCMSG